MISDQIEEMDNRGIKGREHTGVWVRQGGKLEACPRSW